jgi:hypothetical protein
MPGRNTAFFSPSSAGNLPGGPQTPGRLFFMASPTATGPHRPTPSKRARMTKSCLAAA